MATPCHTQDSICYYVTDSGNPDQKGVFTGYVLSLGHSFGELELTCTLGTPSSSGDAAASLKELQKRYLAPDLQSTMLTKAN